MRTGWNEHLGPSKGRRVLLTLLLREDAFQRRQVIRLFFLNMLRQILHQSLDGRNEFRIRRRHILEFLQLLFDLEYMLTTFLR